MKTYKPICTRRDEFGNCIYDKVKPNRIHNSRSSRWNPKPPPFKPTPRPGPKGGNGNEDVNTRDYYPEAQKSTFKPRPGPRRLSAADVYKARLAEMAMVNNEKGRAAVEIFKKDSKHNGAFDDVRVRHDLSNKQALVTEHMNAGGQGQSHFRVVFPGSEMPFSSATSKSDWLHNLGVYAGRDSEQTNNAREAIQNLINEGHFPKELIGFSKGGQIAIQMGKEFGIDTTAFNPNITRYETGVNPANTGPSGEPGKIQVIRTPSDPASYLRRGAPGGWDVKTVPATSPGADKHLLKAHTLDNFTQYGRREGSAQAESAARDVVKAGQVHQEFIELHKMQQAIANGDSFDQFMNDNHVEDGHLNSSLNHEARMKKLWNEERGVRDTMAAQRQVRRQAESEARSAETKQAADMFVKRFPPPGAVEPARPLPKGMSRFQRRGRRVTKLDDGKTRVSPDLSDAPRSFPTSQEQSTESFAREVQSLRRGTSETREGKVDSPERARDPAEADPLPDPRNRTASMESIDLDPDLLASDKTARDNFRNFHEGAKRQYIAKNGPLDNDVKAAVKDHMNVSKAVAEESYGKGYKDKFVEAANPLNLGTGILTGFAGGFVEKGINALYKGITHKDLSMDTQAALTGGLGGAIQLPVSELISAGRRGFSMSSIGSAAISELPAAVVGSLVAVESDKWLEKLLSRHKWASKQHQFGLHKGTWGGDLSAAFGGLTGGASMAITSDLMKLGQRGVGRLLASRGGGAVVSPEGEPLLEGGSEGVEGLGEGITEGGSEALGDFGAGIEMGGAGAIDTGVAAAGEAASAAVGADTLSGAAALAGIGGGASEGAEAGTFLGPEGAVIGAGIGAAVGGIGYLLGKLF